MTTATPRPEKSDPLAHDPVARELREAEFFVRIYFGLPEHRRLAAVLMREYDERGRRLDQLVAERDRLRDRLTDTEAERDAIRDGAGVADLPARLWTAAELVQSAGATYTAQSFRLLANRVEHLPPEVLDPLTRHVLHGPQDPAITETEPTRS